MRRHVLTSLVLLGALAVAAAAPAQVIQPPPRSTRGLFGAARGADPNRAQHQLTLNVDFLGGYEDNISPDGNVVTDPLAPRQSGTTALFSTHAQYLYGTATRFVQVTGRGYMNSFRNLDLRPMYGGDVGLNASTSLGSKAALTGNVSGRYQPTFTLGALGPASPQVQSGAATATDPTIGVSEISSVSGDANTSLAYTWSVRNRTSLGYGFSRQRVESQTLVNSRSHVASLGHNWSLGRPAALLLSYHYSSHASQQPTGNTVPVDSHQGQVGLELRKAVSATRRLVFTGGAGAVRVETVSFADASARPFEYTAPSYFGGVRLDLGRTWSATADLRRDVTVIEGITQQSFLTDVASLWLGGNLGRSWVTAVNASFSQGRPHEGELGSYESLNGTAQLQYALARCCTVVGSYSYYAHRLRDLSAIPSGFPSRFDRNAVSVGFTLWLPLYGSFPAGRPASGRN